MTTKIATCCYCGSRTLLRLTARGGHELACGNCGAPLHEMKALPEKKSKEKKRAKPYSDRRTHVVDDRDRYERKKKKKRRKPMWSRAFEEAFDFVEDIFD